MEDDARPQKPPHYKGGSAKTSPKSQAGSLYSQNPSLPRASSESKPPPYSRYAWAAGVTNGLSRHTDEEKYARLRSRDASHRRGGWGRILIILLVALVVIIALAVGLGVGLTRHKSKSSSSSSNSGSSSSQTQLAFPIGEYTLSTSLTNSSTSCVSNSAIWRCYPYSTYDPSDASLSAASFNWILTNTSATYAANSSSPLTTDSTGVPANISITSSDNPFSITLTNQSLTYINNASSPYYTFSFTQSKTVIPTTSINSDNSASKCFFNQTEFVATLYLSDTAGSTSSNSAMTSYPLWPYAVDVRQVAQGGQNVPDCYETDNGAIGTHISGFTAESASEECICEYKNYNL